MMRILGGMMLVILLLPVYLQAQDDVAQVGYAYVTYFQCDPAREARADEIIKRNYQPHYDTAVKQGDIAQWSWLAHFVGGTWRRALVLSAQNTEDLLSAAGALGEAIEEATPEAGRIFSEVCYRHDDYIWQSTADIDGMTAGDARGKAGFSTYLKCDMGREDRADEIMRETFAPIYNRYVQEGKLASWTWLQHYVGGEYRRLLAVTGESHESLLLTRDEIIAELQERRIKRAADEFGDICHSHSDYMWDIQVETP